VRRVISHLGRTTSTCANHAYRQRWRRHVLWLSRSWVSSRQSAPVRPRRVPRARLAAGGWSVARTRDRARVRWLALGLWAASCAPSDGPLLVRDDAAGSGEVGARSPVQLGASLQYQITGALDTSVDAQLFVTDLFDTRAQDVTTLHARGRVVLAYVSVGTFEPWRADAERFPAAAIGMRLARYPGESWLDVRHAEVRAAMEARFELARTKGFDGVFVSGLGAYAANSGFPLRASDQLQYDGFIAQAARERGLSPGLSNDFELGDELAELYDWALTVGCVTAGDCAKLAAFRALHKPVFNLETEGSAATLCPMARALGIPTTLKRGAYDAWREPCS